LIHESSLNGGDYPNYQILIPYELGNIVIGDTITHSEAKYTFAFSTGIAYVNGIETFISTGIHSAYPPDAVLGDLPENIPNITFLFSDNTHIPQEYYQ